MDIKAKIKDILLKAKINDILLKTNIKNILFKVLVKVLASTTLTFAVTFGTLFSVIFLFQLIRGLHERVVEIEPLSLLLIPTAIAMLMVGLRIALIRRYSNIRL